jgi:hypothetical protein
MLATISLVILALFIVGGIVEAAHILLKKTSRSKTRTARSKGRGRGRGV